MWTKGSAPLAALLLVMAACNRQSSGLPSPGSTAYKELCSSFYLGLAALQSGEDVRARSGLKRATEIAPGEPSGWANLGLLDARQQEFDAAYSNFDKARVLAPDNSRIEAFLGLVESKRGKITESLAHYRKAISLDTNNLRARYSLAMETERQQNPDSDAGAAQHLDQLLALRPQNVPVLLDRIRIAAKVRDTARLQSSVAALSPKAPAWPEPAQEQWAQLQQAAKSSDHRAAATHAQFLRNILLRTPDYRKNLEEVKLPDTAVGDTFLTFLKLPSPSSEPAAPDLSVRFESATSLPNTSGSGLAWIGTIPLDGEGRPAIAWASGGSLHLDSGAKIPLPAGQSLAILGVDLNYDFKTDLVVTTQAGLKIYRQDTPARFVDVTAQAKLPPSTLSASYTAAWTFDFDLDGDLDLVLATARAETLVLRNNGDGSFAERRPFPGVSGITAFSTADIDADGVPDAAMIDADGRLAVFNNERLGSYRKIAIPAEVGASPIISLTAGDVDGNGQVDFVVLRSDHSVARLSMLPGQASRWDFNQIIERDPASPAPTARSGLFLADLDNNGALDIIAGDRVLLNADGKKFTPLSAKLPTPAAAVADLNQDGRLDVVALSNTREAVTYLNRGAKKYNWQVIRTRAATVMGDQRINPFGIGGEIEIRSGLLTQKQMLTSPILHFGLGEQSGVEFARIVWPNGLVQAEFALQANQSVLAQQRLKGSCPFLFTWDGQQMRFLKDVAPMSAPLGAHLDGQTIENIIQTEQWFKIDHRQLVPRRDASGGPYYDLRLTNEYWETYYIDRYSLVAVDHPKDTEIWVDERVADPPAPLAVYVTAGQPKAFISVRDHQGRDAASAVRNLDATYLEGFGVGQYQGLTGDHWVELELPADAPRSGGPLYLIADGFIHPWDDTVTIARSQGGGPHPQDLSLEAQDPASGRWNVVKSHLGIPAGRLKTIVLDLNPASSTRSFSKFRLRTSMEIYWDRLGWAPGLDTGAAGIQTQRLAMSAADLRYRGYSLLTQRPGTAAAPELADYSVLAQTGQRWRHLEGYYTRYGDVRELLTGVDDRITIVASGDELRMRFSASTTEPKPGWVRDFVFTGNGWLKEGDYNFVHSRTVLPLPFNGMRSYEVPLLPLEKDPGYRLHPSDWQTFHTRYLTSEQFARALWSRGR